MFLAPNRITPTSFNLASSGAGQALLATTPWQDLFNGRPADVTRLQWINAVAGIADHVDFQFDWATTNAQVLGAVALYGFAPDQVAGVPAPDQFKIVFTGRRNADTLGTYPYALGNNSATQTTYLRDDGSTVCICILPPGLTAVSGLQMSIFNNRAGGTALLANQLLSLGDIWISPGYVYEIDGNWKDTYPDDPISESPNHQPWPMPYPPGRVFNGQRTHIPFAEAYQNTGKPGWQQLRTQTGSGQSSLLAPRFGASQSSIDATMTQIMTRMGLARFSEMDRDTAGDYFNVTFTHAETPTLGA